MTSRRVILHIGAPKTGTTYLQRMLWRNRAALQRDGILIPGRHQGDHFRLGRDVREDPEPALHPDGSWTGTFERIVQEIEAAAEHTAIISDERLAGATAEQASRVLERLRATEVHILYGIRDFSGLLASEWQQTVKHGNARHLRAWLERIEEHHPTDWFWRVHDVADVLRRWSPETTENIHVITLPLAGAGNHELWERVRRVAGWTTTADTKVERSNESLGYLEATLLADIQRHIPDGVPPARRTRIIKDFIASRVLSGRDDPMRILIPDSARAWVARESAARKEYLRTAGVDLIGDLDELDDRDQRFGDVTTRGHEDVMLDAALEVIAALQVRQQRQAERLERLEHRRHRGRSGAGIVATVTDLRLNAPVRRHARRDEVLAEVRRRTSDPAVGHDVPANPTAELLAGATALAAEMVAEQARSAQRADRVQQKLQKAAGRPSKVQDLTNRIGTARLNRRRS